MALSFMNITEKILARASEKNTVSPDDIVFAKVDKVMAVSYTHLRAHET